MNLKAKIVLVLGMTMVCTSCNHLFYFPDRLFYQSPAKVGLKFTPFSIPSGGRELAAWKIFAQEKKGERAPKASILHFHGNSQNMTAHFLFVSWLAHAGYDVYVFDYQGYGISEGVPSRAGTVEDGSSFLRHVARETKGDLVVIGQSLGAAIAVPVVASSKEERVRALILESGFGSYRRMAQEKLGNFWLTWIIQWPLSLLVSDDYAAQDYARLISIPVLLIHGEKDEVVSLEEGQQLAASFLKRKNTFWKIPKAGHTSAFVRGSPYREKLLIFLDEVLAKDINY